MLNGSLILGLRSDKGITGIYNDLIKDLVEARVECDLLVGHLVCSRIRDPASLLVSLRATDIGIGQLKNMLTVSMFLILVGHCVYQGKGPPHGSIFILAIL